MNCMIVNEEDIVDFLEGRLPRHRREHVEKHICDCDACRDFLMLAAALIYEEDHHQIDSVTSAVTQRAVDAVAALANDQRNWKKQLLNGRRRLFETGRALLESAKTLLPPQAVVLRSVSKTENDDPIRNHITGPGFKAVIEIEKNTATHFNLQVERIFDGKVDMPIRVGLYINTHEVASATLLQKTIQFDDIPNGKYMLKFSHSSQQIGEYTFIV